ncbi:hypothetical protein FB451DRAFT_1263351 [Mycena latifolia]|nr:hypothetical protein FB451DRAFT_1263351 [Mycena latifolia]
MAESDSLQRADALWFSPEVVVLRADTRIFRVFAAILKAQSSVFADMFTFPQPASAEMETMDGFPVVKLHDDSEEVEVFLKAIFDSSFFMPFPANPHFDHVVGILRLAHKYDVPYLRRRALEHLGVVFPTSLSEYDADPRTDGRTIRNGDFPHMSTVIKVAAEVNALWLLPFAYYRLCNNPIASIMSGPWWTALGNKERTACYLGYVAQIQYFPKAVGFLSASSSETTDCDDWAECNRALLSIASGNLAYLSMTEPLETGLRLWQELEYGVCGSCLKAAQVHREADRQEFWNQLPQMFGLPGWEELQEMRRAALST